eukprot:1285141-Rhodomonas_salina.2
MSISPDRSPEFEHTRSANAGSGYLMHFTSSLRSDPMSQERKVIVALGRGDYLAWRKSPGPFPPHA